MFDVVLFEPEIPPNSGNIIRLCANSGARLHLIEPLGFTLGDRELRRAGLDYREYVDVRPHPSLDACLDMLGATTVFAFTTRGTAALAHTHFPRATTLLFGPESRGLPATVLTRFAAHQCVRIPMVAGSRSLNLSNAVAIALYEAWRQHGYGGNAEAALSASTTSVCHARREDTAPEGN